MSLRPYLTSSQGRKKEIKFSYQKRSSNNQSKESSYLKEKQKISQIIESSKQRPLSNVSEYKINLLSK